MTLQGAKVYLTMKDSTSSNIEFEVFINNSDIQIGECSFKRTNKVIETLITTLYDLMYKYIIENNEDPNIINDAGKAYDALEELKIVNHIYMYKEVPNIK